MDWTECIKRRLAKDVMADDNLIKSLRDMAKNKIKASNSLSMDFHHSKITLLYDALREILESIALEKGFKIYNHECYTAFLKEILHLSEYADKFDSFRKIRNGINYYGQKISVDEAEAIIEGLQNLIKKFQNNWI